MLKVHRPQWKARPRWRSGLGGFPCLRHQVDGLQPGPATQTRVTKLLSNLRTARLTGVELMLPRHGAAKTLHLHCLPWLPERISPESHISPCPRSSIIYAWEHPRLVVQRPLQNCRLHAGLFQLPLCQGVHPLSKTDVPSRPLVSENSWCSESSF